MQESIFSTSRRRIVCGLFTIAAFNFFSPAQSFAQESVRSYAADPGGKSREHPVDMEHLKLELKFDAPKGKVIGTATHSFTVIRDKTDSLFLDGISMSYSAVELDGKPVKFEGTKDGITIRPEASLTYNTHHTLKISYECTPTRGIYFIGWNDSTNRSRKQIWTQGEEFDNRNWIPCYDDPDDKLTTETIVTIDSKYKVLSNGAKTGQKKNKDGTTTWHYSMSHPHTLYLVMLGIGDYDIKTSKSANGVPIYEWYYPDKKNTLEPTYRFTERIMDILQQETDYHYGWESYSQIPVQEFIYGAMENTTATIFGDFFCVDDRGFLDRNYVSVNAHEMAHQWFGDLVSARSPRDQWLQESFATHYAKLAIRGLYGKDYFDWERHNEANSALDASKSNRFPIVNTQAGGARIYQKGSFVLDMLKYVTSEEEYRRAVKYYLDRFAYKNVTTYDLETAFNDALGYNMDWFFDEWLYRGGEPEYKVSWEKSADATSISVYQVQQQNQLVGLFKMPIEVEVHYKDGTTASAKEWVSEQYHRFRIPNPGNKEVDFVLFDPGNHVLKTVDFDKSFEELSSQLLKAPELLDRFDALAALRTTPVSKKQSLLIQAYNKETFHAMKEEILNQLGPDSSDAAKNLFLHAIVDHDAHVRLAAINNVEKISRSESELPSYEKLLSDSSYAVTEAALTKLTALYPENKSHYLDLTKGVEGMSKSIRITWLRLAIQDKPSDPTNAAYLKELVDYTSPSFEFRTRINAFSALQALNYLDIAAIKGLINAYQSANGRLSRPAADVISNFAKQDNYRALIKKTVESGRYTDDQKESLLKLLKP